MTGAMIEILISVQIAVGLALIVVLALRRPLRRLAGPQLAFAVWALPLIAAVAVLAPGPYVSPQLAAPTGEASIRSVFFEQTREHTSAATPTGTPAAVAPAAHGEAPTALRLGPASLLWIWAIGAGSGAAILFARQLRYQRALAPLSPAPDLGGGVYRAASCEHGVGLVGVIRPRIIVPADFETRFNKDERALILAHERQHQRAGHAQLNAVAALLQVICWVNPMIHMAPRWFRLDQELACDAAVLSRTTSSVRTYGSALLRAQTAGAAPMACSWNSSGSLQTRIAGLTARAPNFVSRLLGLAGLTLLCACVGAAGWAARPENHTLAGAQHTTSTPAADEYFDVRSVRLDRLHAHVDLIVEERDDVVLDGHQDGGLSVRIDDGVLIVSAIEAAEVCNGDAGASQALTLYVPRRVRVDASGRINADVTAPDGASLHLDGCGQVSMGDVQGPVDLAVRGSVNVHGSVMTGQLEITSTGNPNLQFARSAGGLKVTASGGTNMRFGGISGGGEMNLSGGSKVTVDVWRGALDVNVAGGSDIRIADLESDSAELDASGSGQITILSGQADQLLIEQSASGEVRYSGGARQSRIRNSGDLPVTIRDPGQIDSQGLMRIIEDPPPADD